MKGFDQHCKPKMQFKTYFTSCFQSECKLDAQLESSKINNKIIILEFVEFVLHLEVVGYDVWIKVEKVWFNATYFQAIRQQRVKNFKGVVDFL